MSSLNYSLDVREVEVRGTIGGDVTASVGGRRSDLIMFDQTDPPKFASASVDRRTSRIVG